MFWIGMACGVLLTGAVVMFTTLLDKLTDSASPQPDPARLAALRELQQMSQDMGLYDDKPDAECQHPQDWMIKARNEIKGDGLWCGLCGTFMPTDSAGASE